MSPPDVVVRPVSACSFPRLAAAALVAGLLALAPAALAQLLAPVHAPRPVGTATAVVEGPVVDGDVLDDPVWEAATPLAGFWQEQPYEGQPSTGRTEVRVVFTADTLYVGVVCYDSDPSAILVSDARRDAPLDETDSFRFILDTYQDRQNGFVFGTNPAGIEYDGQVTNEGQGGGGLGAGQMQMGRSGSGFNLNWDGAWDVRARTTAIGWSVWRGKPPNRQRSSGPAGGSGRRPEPAVADPSWSISRPTGARPASP